MDSQRAAGQQRHQRPVVRSHIEQFRLRRGNEYADLLTGNLSNYDETNFNRINDINYSTYEFFGQDSWKATRKLTVDFGVRFTHFTPWIDGKNFGYSIFDQIAVSARACAVRRPSADSGGTAKNSSVPLGGFPPGNCSISHGSVPPMTCSEPARPCSVVVGVASTTIPGSLQRPGRLGGRRQRQYSPTTWVGGPGWPTESRRRFGSVRCVSVMRERRCYTSGTVRSRFRDDKQPYTDSWSFTVAQRTPWQGLLEVAYIGNRSRDLPSSGWIRQAISTSCPSVRCWVHPIPATLIPSSTGP